MQFYEKYLDISPEIEISIKKNIPVVALESTIISHGMPYPQNVHTARKVEEIIKENGAVPATIAILNGKLKVGLTPEEIDLLGKLGPQCVKTSKRDIPFIISKKLNGATTVASTMIIASLAGIRVFATGGIGGVHRGAESSFDVSADLLELARTSVAVVCAGAKSILDIGLTLEYLETHGVPVVGYQTEELPAFYSRRSGFKVDYRVDSPLEISEALKIKWELGLNGGMVVANPVPEEYSMDHKMITEVIEEALKESSVKNIRGKEITPFLLEKVEKMTGGKSLKSNIQLIYNNAKLAAEISKEFSKLIR